jgi:hypothetical protein
VGAGAGAGAGDGAGLPPRVSPAPNTKGPVPVFVKKLSGTAPGMMMTPFLDDFG